MGDFWFVAIGGAIGALGRYWLSHFNRSIPFGTLVANLLGSFALGFLFTTISASNWYLFIGIGLMGALTTFSTLNIEVVKGWKKQSKHMLSYLITTYILGLALAWLGIKLGQWVI